MARTKISEFSDTAADNTDINNIDIAEGCAPSGINNAIREMMKQLKDFQSGTSGDPIVSTSTVTATKLVPTGNVTAGNGMYLPAANTVAFSTNGAERVRVDSSGNVGIGTSNPLSNLEISSTGFTEVTVRSTRSTPGQNLGDYGFGDGISGFSSLRGLVGGSLAFRTGAVGDAPERMRIDSSGNVLFQATELPSATVSGSGFHNTSSGRSVLTMSSTGTGGLALVRFFNPNGAVGNIVTSGTSTSYNTSSDYRLKENLTPISDALTRVAAIPVYRFNFKADPDKTVDGFVAHELAPHVPEAVTGEKDEVETVEIKDDDGNVTGTEEKPVYQGVDQSKLTPLLTAAIQQLLAKVETLEAEVAALKGQA